MTIDQSPTEAPLVGPETVLRRVGDLEWVAVADELVLHRVSWTKSWVLNPTAGLMWQCLDGESTVGEILADVADAFSVDAAQVHDDFLPVLDTWVREGVAEDPARPWDPVAAMGDFRLVGAGRWRRLQLPPNDCRKAEKARWPHHLVVDVDGAAVTVASDDPAIVDALRPWAISLDTELIDYVLQLSPPIVEGRGIRSLPTLSRGCEPLFRIRDRDELRRALWRLLASFARPRTPNEVAIQLMPLVHDGRALLLPPGHAGAISHRWYAKFGITPGYTAACVVDVDTLTVRLEPLFVAEPGGDAIPSDPIPILDWWIPTADPSYDLRPGEAVAQVMRLAVGVDEENAGVVLRAATRLVSERLPGLAPLAPDRYVEALRRSWADEMRRQLFDAIVARFERG